MKPGGIYNPTVANLPHPKGLAFYPQKSPVCRIASSSAMPYIVICSLKWKGWLSLFEGESKNTEERRLENEITKKRTEGVHAD